MSILMKIAAGAAVVLFGLVSASYVSFLCLERYEDRQYCWNRGYLTGKRGHGDGVTIAKATLSSYHGDTLEIAGEGALRQLHGAMRSARPYSVGDFSVLSDRLCSLRIVMSNGDQYSFQYVRAFLKDDRLCVAIVSGLFGDYEYFDVRLPDSPTQEQGVKRMLEFLKANAAT